jgi:hypothetical protein
VLTVFMMTLPVVWYYHDLRKEHLESRTSKDALQPPR